MYAAILAVSAFNSLAAILEFTFGIELVIFGLFLDFVDDVVNEPHHYDSGVVVVAVDILVRNFKAISKPTSVLNV
jgi:sulfite exporter TauE/SafE